MARSWDAETAESFLRGPQGLVSVIERVLLGNGVRAAMDAHGRDAYPDECCGLLLGERSSSQVRIFRTQRARNLLAEDGGRQVPNLESMDLEPGRSRDRYLMDPRDQLAAEEEAEAEGLEVVGVYHTHPDHPARPSEYDRSHAWEGWAYLILSVKSGEPSDLGAFVLEKAAGRFVEVPVSSGP